jgi:hypothetical protein
MKSGILKFAAFASWLALGTSMALAWGELTTLRVIQTQTILIRYKASEEQRRAAESNAKSFFSQLTPAKKADLKKRNVHTVLIRTVRSRQTSPGAKEVRMRYSLEGESLIDDYAYDFAEQLQPGSIAQVKGLDAEYVGQ